MKYDKLDYYSIWLETDNAKGCVHQEMISDISRTANTTAFAPHITLVGNIKKWPIEVIRNKLAELAENTFIFDVEFSYIVASPNWLNVILLFAKRNSQLSNLYLRAERIFEKPSLFYLPHLSLLYGKTPRIVKRSMAKKVKESGILELPFTINRISLWHCRNGVANWERKASVKLLSLTK